MRARPTRRRPRTLTTTGTRDTTTITAMIGSRYCSTPGQVEAPSRCPARVRPTAQTTPPTICQSVNVAMGTRSAPATGLITVRTTGTNRASTIALP